MMFVEPAAVLMFVDKLELTAELPVPVIIVEQEKAGMKAITQRAKNFFIGNSWYQF